MRAPADMPRRPRRREPGRGRTVAVVAVAVLVVVWIVVGLMAEVWTDQLWFESVGQGDVWWGILQTQAGLAGSFALGFAVLLWVNLVVADRVAPLGRAALRDDLLLRYQDVVERRAWVVRLAVSAVFGVVAGFGVSGLWPEWVLFANGGEFGETDPVFGRDVGFYVFDLPFLTEVTSTVFASLFLVLVITVVAHYLNGGISLADARERVSPAVKAHLSVLLALLALVKAYDYYLQRFHLTLSSRGYVDGAGYTDVQAQLPATDLLVVISVLSALLFVWNIRRRGWVLPTVAVGLWALVAGVAGALYPQLVQVFVVDPAESDKEAPYIAYNVAATRDAMGISEDRVEVVPYPGDGELSADELEANMDIVGDIRLLTPERNLTTFDVLQRSKSYYAFSGLDIDRYPIDLDGDGEPEQTPVLIGTRELDADNVPQKSWEGRHLAFIAGHGTVLAAANEVNDEGEPEFLLRNVPVQQDARIDVGLAAGDPDARPELYFGEGLHDYVIVNGEYVADEADDVAATAYTGEGGVGVGSFLRKLAFAVRFGDHNMLISGFVGEDARVLHLRDIHERLETVAPFLTFDSNPYPVTLDGRVLWVVDGYTTSAWYPNAQRVDTSAAAQVVPEGSPLAGTTFNYIRNSVKATVDAYTGDITLYVVDDEDPLIDAYRRAFPSLFADGSTIPDDLKAHFRYPEDLFRVQTTMYARYHLPASQFYEQAEGWSVAGAPGEEPQSQVAATPAGVVQTTVAAAPIDPQYVQMRLPGEDESEFVLLRSFTPTATGARNINVLSAFMVAGSDPGPDRYGRLRVYEVPPNAVDAPSLVASQIESDSEIREQLSLLDRDNSDRVSFGDLLLVPIEDSMLYVRPVYLRAQANGVPQLVLVAIQVNDRTVMRPTLREALEAVFPDVDVITYEAGKDPSLVDPDDPGPDDPDDPPSSTSSTSTPTSDPSTPPSSLPGTAAELLAQAEAKLAEAETVLREQGAAGLGEYVALLGEARALLEQALALAQEATGSPPGTTPESTAPPDTSPPAAPTTDTTAGAGP